MSRIHAVLAAVTIVGAAGLAHVAVPRELMAISTEAFDLQKVVPDKFGEWTADPRIRLIAPPEPDGFARQFYSQEIARGYRDREGNLVMLLVAYGPNQSSRLQIHRPEICYTADGFRVSSPSRVDVTYREGAPPLKLLRLTARREARVEPISYWMRVGDDISTNQVDRQLIKLKLAMQRQGAGRRADARLHDRRCGGQVLRRCRTASSANSSTRWRREHRAFFFGGDRTKPLLASRCDGNSSVGLSVLSKRSARA